MCLLLIAYRQHPDYPLIVAGNRDEYYGRPTEPAAWRGDILSGLDLEAGGTWMGVARSGRFAVVTNYRDPADHLPDARSRGILVSQVLSDPASDVELYRRLHEEGQLYNGFNLVFGGPDGLYSVSNRGPGQVLSEPGVYGLSNHLFETPWPKVERGKAGLRRYVEQGAAPNTGFLFELLANRERPRDEDLPHTGVGLEFERLLSTIFISSAEYGTRASTVLLYGHDGRVLFAERSYGPHGQPLGEREFRFRL